MNRSLPEGGFAISRGEPFRADATAWAVLALEAYRGSRDLTVSACRRLSECQLLDGRLSAVDGHPEAYWPTALALFAWKTVPGFEKELDRAIQFLIVSSGKISPKQDNDLVVHDTSIKGWPWIENTHSWIDPTSIAILALKACGYEKHERVLEAVRMILDRQLPAGGWNYGNTVVFGKQLRPIPESTGHALCALAGYAEAKDVKSSINYLNHEVVRIRTPLALSWSILGLTAWSNRPVQARDWILESLALQKKYGTYDTSLLAQLIIAYCTTGDFLSLFLD
jgi:hypothetical protein